MGFALQLLSNGASRLVYMYLLGVLNQLNVAYAAPHATLLANANGLCALFSLNAYQYYIAKKTPDVHADLLSCETQFKLLVTLWFVSIGAMVIVGDPAATYHLLPTLVAAFALALPELSFTMATARDKTWRSVLFYGGQMVFFCGYMLAILQQKSPVHAALYATVPTVVINLLAYKTLRSDRPRVPLSAAFRQLLQECRVRLGTLVASLPVIATPSAMIYGLGRHPDTAAQIPQMLLFSSLVGAVVFVMGNFFQHYGKHLIPRLLGIQRQGNHRALFTLVLGVFALCLALTMPVDMLLSYARQSFQHNWAHDWYIYATITASGAVILQWYTVICIHHGHTRAILWSNLAYFLLASALAATTLLTHIHVFAVLAFCAALRSILNIIGFSLAST